MARKPKIKRYKDMTPAERQEHDKAVAEAGGWYLYSRQKRLERDSRIVELPEREVIKRPRA